jgi:hypothetical protein
MKKETKINPRLVSLNEVKMRHNFEKKANSFDDALKGLGVQIKRQEKAKMEPNKID